MITDDGTPPLMGDWENGYAKGYDRALEHVLMMIEGDAAINYRAEAAFKSIVAKLRQEVLHDEN